MCVCVCACARVRVRPPRYHKDNSADYFAQKIMMTEVFHMSQKLCPLTLEELGQTSGRDIGSVQNVKHEKGKFLPTVEESANALEEDLPASSQLSPGNLSQDIRKRALPHQESPDTPLGSAVHASWPPFASGAGDSSRTSLQTLESNGVRSQQHTLNLSEAKGLVEQIREKRKAEEVI